MYIARCRSLLADNLSLPPPSIHRRTHRTYRRTPFIPSAPQAEQARLDTERAELEAAVSEERHRLAAEVSAKQRALDDDSQRVQALLADERRRYEAEAVALQADVAAQKQVRW